MSLIKLKQPALKPQDLLVVLKLAIRPERNYTFSELAKELYMSVSEVHAAVKRAEISRLIDRSNTEIKAIQSSLKEFLVHGVQYCFPAIAGQLTRGMPTGVSGPVLIKHFMAGDGLPLVWPEPEGETRGSSIVPIYHSAPAASRLDHKFYELLTLVDALRAGSAREREIAKDLLDEYLK